jgi:hypothetical protein
MSPRDVLDVSSQCASAAPSSARGELSLPLAAQKATFGLLYSKSALYEAVLKVYTKPLFYREKGLRTSHDGQTLYHFAVHGTRNVDWLHTVLSEEKFHFRDGVELRFTDSGRRRIAYIFPWEERITDELLYRMLNKFFHARFSQQSYAFRYRGFGIDDCQHRVARCLGAGGRPLYVLKRDVRSYYPSVNQDLLLTLLEQWIEPSDYLYQLLRERVKFWVRARNGDRVPGRGIPFGTPVACLLANIYLTPLDVAMAGVPGLNYFRYADDVLAFSSSREAAREARDRLSGMLAKLKLASKPSHELNICFTHMPIPSDGFSWASKFRHLGLEFRVDGSVGLPRAKGRKIRNLFRQAFRKAQPKLASLHDGEERAELLASVARDVLEHGYRSIAILDYYLKHIDDEQQLRLLDRWLAEEVLARTFGDGHRKGNFRQISFKQLRQMGLPSLRHRRRLLRHGNLESSFFTLWTEWLVDNHFHDRASRARRPGGEGTVARS